MASKYWVGGGSNTNWTGGAVTNWANTSGGAGNQTEPTTGDDVFFDASSGSGTSVYNTALSLRSLDCNGYTGTLTHNTITLTITGTNASAPSGFPFRLVSGMTYTKTSNGGSALAFASTTGTVGITTGTKELGSSTIGSAGTGATFILNDALAMHAAATLTHNAGIFDANDFNVSCGFFNSSNSNVRELIMGSGTWTITGVNVTVWNMQTATNLTVTPETSTILLSAVPTSVRSIQMGGKAFYNLSVVNATPDAYQIDLGATGFTVNNLVLTNVLSLRVINVTYTIQGTWAWTGGSASQLAVCFSASAIATVALSNNSTLNYVVMQNTTRSGAGSLTVTPGIDSGNNTSITFGALASPAARVIGG